MQDRPEKEVLLDALANFLIQQVRPAVSDPGLNFRVLIAANIAVQVAAEIRGEEAQDAAELRRLRELLADVPVSGDLATRSGQQAATKVLNHALAERLKLGTVDFAKATEHLKQTLIEKLAVNNPRFDTALEIEGG
jgi:hypothetical protein